MAVSGGPDSVGLLRALLAVKQRSGGDGRIFVAHFNHKLRGSAADEDQAWVIELCHGLNLPLEIGQAATETTTAAVGNASEAAARAARYNFLRETAEKFGARYVAVAHTADDQVETVLHRILRGTGLEGLAGMPASRPLSLDIALVRPLLTVRRADVLAYLHEIGQAFRVDESNTNSRWTRNRLRHELLPVLRARFNPQVDDALLRLAEQAREAHLMIAGTAGELARACVRVESAASAVRVVVLCQPLRDKAPLLTRDVCKIAWQQAGWPLQAMGFAEWQQLAELVHAERDSPLTLPGDIRARRENQSLILESRS
jgi:tRNA(Ile)-lysidine synthase